MENWNKTGKIKAVLLVVFGLPNLIAPIGANPDQGLLVSILMPLIFGSIAIPIISKLNSASLNLQIVKPNWNDNPLRLKRPLSFFHFGGFFFISIGLSIIIGTAIKYRIFNLFGLTSLSFGIGILIGIRLTLKWNNQIEQKGANNV